MRAIGTAERALEMMCRRANEREAFGGPLADKQFVQEAIAASRMEIDQARLLTLYAAWKMDTEGKRAARQAISAIKVVAANIVMDVLDRAIQVHGSLGMTDDTPLAALWRFSRMLRLADGPDEVHKMVLARRELNRWAKRDEAEAAGELEPQARPAADLRGNPQIVPALICRALLPIVDSLRYLIRYRIGVEPPNALVRKLRVSAGLSQRALARRAGTSQPAVARDERGAATPWGRSSGWRSRAGSG